MSASPVLSQSNYVFPFPANPSLAVRGSAARFPVRRVFCIGRNYAEHAREMGHDPDREAPFYFMKPAWALAIESETVDYPPMTDDLHHEIELVVALGKGGSAIVENDALDLVYGYTVGIDLTRRDRQGEAKKAGRPWEVGKAFTQSAPIGEVIPAAEIGHPSEGRIWLEVDGTLRQDGDLSQLTWSVPELIAQVSRYDRLEPGDLIFTGTPAGVGPVTRGQRLRGGVAAIGEIDVTMK